MKNWSIISSLLFLMLLFFHSADCGVVFFAAGLRSRPHHPAVVWTQLGEPLGRTGLLAFLPANSLIRSDVHALVTRLPDTRHRGTAATTDTCWWSGELHHVCFYFNSVFFFTRLDMNMYSMGEDEFNPTVCVEWVVERWYWLAFSRCDERQWKYFLRVVAKPFFTTAFCLVCVFD